MVAIKRQLLLLLFVLSLLLLLLLCRLFLQLNVVFYRAVVGACLQEYSEYDYGNEYIDENRNLCVQIICMRS